MSWLDRINEQDQADPSFRPSYDTPLPFEGSDVAAGAERGGFGLRSALSGAVGDTRGAEYYGARAAGTPTRFNSYKDVDPLSLDVIDYVQQVGGEQAPNMALMAATGGVAGAAAKSLMAGRVGAGAASGMMQFGEMSNELRQQGLEPTAVTAGAAALGGALDVIGLESLTKGMLKSAVGEQIKSEVQANAATRALRGAFGGFIEGVKNELPAELSQEVLAVGNRAYSDPSYLKKTDEIADRFAETAVATTAFAGPLGAAPGAMGGMRSATPEAPPVTPGADPATPGADAVTPSAKPAGPLGLPLLPSEDMMVFSDGTTARRTQVEEMLRTAEADRDTARAEKLRAALEQHRQDAQMRAAVDETTHRMRQEEEARRRVVGLRASAATANPLLPNYGATTPAYDPFLSASETQSQKTTSEGQTVLDRVRGTPAPSHDMTLEELRALDSSTSSGETYGESQNAAKESTLPPNETGQRQEVLKGAGASAPATSMPAYESPFKVGDDGKYYGYYKPRGIHGGLLSDPKFLERIDQVEAKHGIPSGTLQALMAKESNGKPEAVSPADDAGLHGWGIGQFRNATARGLTKQSGIPIWKDGKVNMDPYVQVEAMGELLSRKRKSVGGDWDDAAWAYNAGEGNVLAYKQSGKYKQFAGKVDPNYKREVVANRDAILRARGVQPDRSQQVTPETSAEISELNRRKTAEEPTYQSTKLGLAYRDGILDGDTEKTGQVDSDDPFRLGATEDEFTLTFKGKKQESRGDDVFKPARPLPETGDDTFEGVTTESTPVRAFTQLYPAAKVTETSDPTDYSKIVSVTLPKTDARDDNEAKTAGRVFEALISGTKDKVEKKIKLEHPDVLSKDSGNPIEIPVTRDGLAKIGRALDPGAYDDKPASAYAAAMSGLTHLIYDKGFTPRGVDTSKPNALEAWVKQQVGEQPVDRTPERATPEQEDRPVTGPVIGSARAEGQTPAPEAGGFTGEEPAPRVEYESKPGYTPVQQAALNHITIEAKRIQQALGPEATDENRVKAWETAVNQVVRQTNPATITVAPETAYYELGADGKPQRVVTQSDTDGAPGNPSVDAAVLGREFESPEQARQALASAGYESLPQLKGPRQFIAMKEANKSTFRLVKTPEGKFRLTTANKATPGLERPRAVTRRELIQIADLAKREFSSALYARRMNAERDQINQEAGQNPESMPLRDELSEDQLLADEGRIGIAEDRAEMADRAQSLGPAVARSLKWNGVQGLSSDINTTLARQELNPPGHNDPGPAKVADRKKATDSTKKLEETASLKRELDNQSIETVHKVSGGATIRATGVAEQVVKFFTDALKNIGLEVPLRVMSKAGIGQHLEALQQRIDGLMKAAEDANATLEGMPGVTGEQRKARAEQSKVLELRSRQLMDAMEERKLLQQAQEDEFAARVIYNDHYLDAARRTPVIVISDEAMSSKNLNIVLAHELGHVVQRAWFDQLPADLQKDIIKELSQDGRYTDDIAEAFADRFMEWYRLNERAQKVRNKQDDIQSSGMGKALRRLADALKRLWSNLVGHDNAFARRYPKFDEFLRSTVGVYGRMKPINPRINKLWTESLAQSYGGLPLVAADSTQFNNMTAGEFAQTVVDGAKAGIDRAARYAENKAGENVVGQRYIRKTNETVDAFKKTAAIALMADGTWLRNAGNGILAGYANIVAPIKGRVMKDMQVIGEVLVRPALSAREPAVYASTEAMNGSIQTLSDQQYGAWRKKLDPILAKVSKLSSTDYKSLVEDLRDETTPSKTPIAREIRKYFAEMLMYMRHHDVKVGARSGYYTKAWDQEKLTDNKDAVIESFEKVFAARDELPVDPRVEVREGQESVKFSTPLAAALHEYQRITEGRVDNLFEQTEEDVDPELRGPSFRYARKRMFTNEEYEQFDLNRWLNDDIAWTMNTYTQLGIKRAVQQQATGIPRAQLRNPVSRRYWEQRFTKAKLRPEVMGSPVASLELLLAEGVQDGRLPYDEYVEAKKRIMSVMGLTNVGSNPRWRRWTNRILAYETLLTMTWSSFAQLADFGISVWRADSMDRVGKVIGQIMDKRTRAEQQELLNTIGLSLDELTRHALNSGLMTTDPMAKGTQIWTEKFFRLNGMHFLSESNLMFASMLGQSYIKDYADKAVNAKTLEERDEAMKRLRELHPTLSPADALTGDFAANPLLQQALHEYVSQSHLHNQIGYTPRIFNDYRFAVFTQLKGFMFKYHNIVLRQMWERMKDRPDLLQAAIPMLTLAMATMPLAFVGMEAKEALRRRLFPKVKRAPKDKTPMQKFHDVLMASGMPGAYVGLFDSALEAPQHGQPGIVALAGPTVGHAFNISSRTADEWLPSSVPIVSSVPWIRSMARQGLRDTFGFGVRDEE